MPPITRRKILVLTGGILGSHQISTVKGQSSSDSTWPMFSYDHKNSGHSTTQGPKRAMSQKWTFETGDAIRSSPAVAHEMVFFGSTDGRVYAVDKTNGDQVWQFETGDSVTGSPVVIDEMVFIGSTDNTLYALDSGTGEEQWSLQLNGSITAGASVYQGVLYVGTDGNTMYAIDTQTGAEQWHAEVGSFVSSTPAIAEERIFFGSADSRIYAFDSSTGEEQWSFKTENGISSSPAVVDGVVYVSSSDGHLYAIESTTGDQVWSFPLDGLGGTSPAVVDDRVYVTEGASGHRVHALDAANGERQWTGETGDSVRASPAVADGVVYIASSDHYVYAIDTEGGELLWRFGTEGPITSSPAVAGETVYVGSTDSKLYALTGEVDRSRTTTAVSTSSSNRTTIKRATDTPVGAANSTENNIPLLPGLLGIIGLGGAGAWWMYSGSASSNHDTPSASRSETVEQGASHRGLPEESTSEGDGTAISKESEQTPTTALGQRKEPETVPTYPDRSLGFNEWDNEEEIEQNSRATVTRALISSTTGEMPIAIKKPHLSETIHVETLNQLLTEAEAWNKIDGHDHIVNVMGYGENPLPWLAMEYMDGGTLREKTEQMDFLQRLWTALVVTKGVYHAHRHGVSHLHITPENILFRSVNNQWAVPKVSDWWLSPEVMDLAREDDSRSVMYLAPEQIDDGYGYANDITDIYQLGVVFYELFTGQLPFERDTTQAKQAILNAQPRPPSEIADVPPELDEVIMTALAKEKEDRYDSVVYLRDRIEEIYKNK